MIRKAILVLAFILPITLLAMPAYAQSPQVFEVGLNHKLEYMADGKVKWTGLPEVEYTEDEVTKEKSPRYQWDIEHEVLYDEEALLEAGSEWATKNAAFDYKLIGGLVSPEENPVYPEPQHFAKPMFEIIAGTDLMAGSQVRGGSQGARKAIADKFRQVGDFIWVDGVGSSGTIVLPRGDYDHVYIATGDWDNPVITDTLNYTVQGGKTYIEVGHFSGGGGVHETGKLVLWYQPDTIISGTTLPDRSYRLLHFKGSATSNVNCGVSYNATAKFWASCWFKLDENYAAGSGNMYILGKHFNATNFLRAYLANANGRIYFVLQTGGVPRFTITTDTLPTWNAGQWYHVIFSISDVNGARVVVNNADIFTNANLSAAPDGGDFIIGDSDDPGAGTGFEGIIANFITGTDDLTTTEETALYTGTAPGDETDYWYIDEGTGTTINSYGSLATTGTADTATYWVTGNVTYGGAPYPHLAPGDDGYSPGTFVWGANPALITVTLGSMVSSGQPSLGADIDQPTQDILEDVEVSDWFVEPDVGVGGALLTNPIRPFVTLLSDNSTLTEHQVWILYGLAFVLFVTVATSAVVRGHHGITGIMCAASMIGLVSLTIWPLWTVVFIVSTVIVGLVSERSPSL